MKIEILGTGYPILFNQIRSLPFLLFELPTAIRISIIWGLSILCLLSYRIALEQKVSPWKVIAEHLVIASIVIILTHYLGDWIASRFR